MVNDILPRLTNAKYLTPDDTSLWYYKLNLDEKISCVTIFCVILTGNDTKDYCSEHAP